MPEDDVKNDLKSEIAQHKPRDEEGHFVHVEEPKDPQQPAPHENPVSKFFSENTHYSKGKDDLLDVHVGNPLHKITQLLEDIKKQKAFSFTLKGSLGLAGVALALGIFGIFGGGQILCEKGTQTQIGTVKVLSLKEKIPSQVPFLGSILDFISSLSPYPPNSPNLPNRIVLIKNDETVIQLPFSKEVEFTKYQGVKIVATGDYNSCSQSLRITDPKGIEFYTAFPVEN